MFLRWHKRHFHNRLPAGLCYWKANMKLLRGIRREVTHGGVVPRGWQMAWYEPRRRTGVYYPRPLNWLLGALREFIYRVQLAVHAPRLECAQTFDMERFHRERRISVLASYLCRGDPMQIRAEADPPSFFRFERELAYPAKRRLVHQASVPVTGYC